MKKVGVVILNYKSHRESLSLLHSLKKNDQKNIQQKVYLIDNSPQNTGNKFEKIKKLHFLTLISSYYNSGFTGGNNIGIKKALKDNCDYILILNNDTILDKDIVTNLLKCSAQENDSSIIVPKIYFAKGHEFHKNLYTKNDLGKVIWYAGGILDWDNVIGKHRGVDEIDKGQFDQKKETDYATGACMLVPKKIFEKIGLFEEKYFLYYEDSDLSMRAKKAGFKIVYNPTSFLWHKNAVSSGGSGSSLQDYYTTRNRMLFGIKYAPIKSKLLLLKESLIILRNGREWQKKGIMDFYLQKFGKGSYQFESL